MRKDFSEFEEKMRAESFGFRADEMSDAVKKFFDGGMSQQQAYAEAAVLSSCRATVRMLRSYHDWLNG